MATPTESGPEEAQLYDELRRAIEEFEEGEERQNVLNRMIRQLRFAKWRKDRMRKMMHTAKGSSPRHYGLS
ncbi:hypothetical protein MHH93_10465 [Priestia sp. FSL H7-0729]